ncbi:MAG TPA: Hsp20/alpha crystallin family protein [Polyangiaceae bacterium]|nr:Hsp20/alpha crystallin family protein [Polyangiaceae bacterium]
MAEPQVEQGQQTQGAQQNGTRSNAEPGGTQTQAAGGIAPAGAAQQGGRQAGHGVQRYVPGAASGLPVPASPFTVIRRMMEDMGRLFENFALGGGLPSPLALVRDMGHSQGGFPPMQLWSPQIEVAERDGKLVVKADLPGLTKDDVRVQVLDGALRIEGERRQERQEERGGQHYTERSYGSFTRTVPLPPGTEAEGCEATFENGVLEVTLALPERRPRGRTVQIKGRGVGPVSGAAAPEPQGAQGEGARAS